MAWRSGTFHGNRIRTEFAEWDLSLEQWRAARYFTLVQFRPDGAISESEHHNPDGSISRSSFTYDAAGRMQEARFGMNGGPVSKNLYLYDELGRLTRVVSVDQDGTEWETETYSYGQDGKRTKVYFVPEQAANAFMYAIEGTVQSYVAPGASAITRRLPSLLIDLSSPSRQRFRLLSSGSVLGLG